MAPIVDPAADWSNQGWSMVVDSCARDRGFDRICEQSSTTDTEHWASKSDFIEEASAVGISKLVSRTRSYPAYRTDVNYEAQGRLSAIIAGATPYETFDQWDDLKRPCTA